MTDPESTPPSSAADRLFYDGDCGLCHHSVLFLIERDEERQFRYAPLSGPTFEPFEERAVEANRGRGLPDSIVLVTRDDEVLVRSDAALYALRRLGGGWWALGSTLRVVPRPLRDLGYRLVARVRHRLFAQPQDVCPVPSGDQRLLFDP